MAGIIARFKDIMSSNINALLDKAEDPAKIINQYLRNLESDLGNVKAETASVMAEEKRSKRALDECNEQINKMQRYAEKALIAGNESDAKTFLEKKTQLSKNQQSLQQSYDIAADNAVKMRSMHDKLVKDIGELNARREQLKAKLAVAKTQERLNKIGSSVDGAKGSLSAFDKMEDKINRQLDEANAMAELNSSNKEDSIEDLMSKYDDNKEANSGVDDELQALKNKLGL
ncbi:MULTISPECIES: PspA/IM30 family protein [Terrisporobacter]|uniref:Phage-shock protein n=2 Tax=Terrisporobacter TaxID=1505652 RepID=A0A0B3W6H6_9FIRM|nr:MULTISPECIES: PspA/IM30 family protein [Terrisporobacter]KHS58017.1 phage-shock protein [Terrisporobacter othiniensis]MCC3669795.1 PspA/IM30 family protein [Terrisporobacter mayombei]MCR1824699.1 PspA/IM30 family protein [Terrisporobacter muris]MDU6984610.1 PspA/IM30 family protein [Terrisporobacter othiniensis]MDY3374778.1 PspA/IM30 family protein [Terrisporobacter othiniensis]